MESCCQEKGSITDIASASALTKTSETSAGTASFAEGSAQGMAQVQYKSCLLYTSVPLSHDRAGIAVALFAAADFHGKVCDRGGGGYAVAHLYADYDRQKDVFHLWRIDPIWTCAELSGGIRLVVPAQQKPECEDVYKRQS